MIRHAPMLPLVVLLIALLGLSLVTPGVGSHQGTPASTGGACEDASPAPGIPAPASPTAFPDAVASPAGVATPCLPEHVVAGVGTPRVEAGLSVTLRADELEAGPVDLTVEVEDAAGRPVTGATVRIETQHLEMNHGVSTDEAAAEVPGRFVAERVGMGMGGTWQADVTIERPDEPPVTVTFLLVLEGSH